MNITVYCFCKMLVQESQFLTNCSHVHKILSFLACSHTMPLCLRWPLASTLSVQPPKQHVSCSKVLSDQRKSSGPPTQNPVGTSSLCV